jgi:hypothetical protein
MAVPIARRIKQLQTIAADLRSVDGSLTGKICRHHTRLCRCFVCMARDQAREGAALLANEIDRLRSLPLPPARGDSPAAADGQAPVIREVLE